MSIIHTNISLNASINRSTGGDRDERIQKRADEPHVSGEQSEALGQSPEAKLTGFLDPGLIENFSKLSDLRYQVIDEAREKLENGHYQERETAIDLAKSIVDKS